MAPLRDGADLIVDTSELSVRGLRAKVGAYFADTGPTDVLKTTVISFGYKFGIPLDADIVLDVRFLPNPHWDDTLRPLDGRDDPVRDFVLGKDVTQDFLARTRDLLAVLLPGYQAEGRHYLTVAIGCTGGRHRSVVLASEVANLAREKGFVVNVIHRDVHRGDTAA
jgi:RNase adapter protein RapZ